MFFNKDEMTSDNKTWRFWRRCELCGEKMPLYMLRDHMIEEHPEILREKGELGKYFDKRALKVTAGGLLYIFLLACLTLLTDISGIVFVILIGVGAAILVVVDLVYVQMRA